MAATHAKSGVLPLPHVGLTQHGTGSFSASTGTQMSRVAGKDVLGARDGPVIHEHINYQADTAALEKEKVDHRDWRESRFLLR